jgi:hypothetical protein
VVNAYAEADATLADSIGAVGGRRSAHAAWLLAAAPLVAFVVQVVATDSDYTTLTKVYVGLLAALTAFALVRCFVIRPPRMPAIEYALGFHYAAFGLPATAGAAGVGVAGIVPRPDAYETAAALALAAAIAMLAGHAAWTLVPPRNSRRRYLPNLTPDTLEAASGPYVLFSAAFVVTLTVFPSLQLRIPGVIAILLALFELAQLATVATIAYVVRPRARTLAQLVIAFGASAVVMVVSSMISSVIAPAVTGAAVWWRFKGKIPVALLASLLMLVIVLQPVKSYYRAIMWGDRSEGLSVAAGWQRAFADASADRYKQAGGDATRERMSEFGTLAYVTELVPRSLPYFGSDVYEQTAISVVPRLFWPDKPNMTKEGLDRYVVALGLSTSELAEHSTTGIQLITHGYASHGVMGGVVWMALFGFVLGAANRFFGQGIAGTLAMACFMMVWGSSMGVGFVNCFGGLWQVIVGTLALVWFLWGLGRLMQATSATLWRGVRG